MIDFNLVAPKEVLEAHSKLYHLSSNTIFKTRVNKIVCLNENGQLGLRSRSIRKKGISISENDNLWLREMQQSDLRLND